MTVVAASTTPHWGILAWSFAGGAMAGVIVFFIQFGLMALRNSRGAQPRLTMGTALVGLGTDWSFADNWVSSVTVGSGVLVGLLAATKAVGTNVHALAVLAVSGAVAAVLVAIGPLFLKVIGSDVNVPTIGGTLVAAVVTLAGTIGEIIAMTWQVQNLAKNSGAHALVLIGVATGLVIYVYAVRTLWYYLSSGAIAPPKVEAVELKAARIIAAAIRKERAPKLETVPESLAHAQPYRLVRHNSLL